MTERSNEVQKVDLGLVNGELAAQYARLGEAYGYTDKADMQKLKDSLGRALAFKKGVKEAREALRKAEEGHADYFLMESFMKEVNRETTANINALERLERNLRYIEGLVIDPDVSVDWERNIYEVEKTEVSVQCMLDRLDSETVKRCLAE